MSILPPKMIDADNLSTAWGKAFLHAHSSTQRSLTPLVVSIGGFSDELPAENAVIRDSLDSELRDHGKNESRVSALTIIPFEMWQRRGRPGIAEFSRLCTEGLAPRLKKRDARNAYGIYFERMMSFVGARQNSLRTCNQLEFVIELLKNHGQRWPRHSALQIACFDPPKDHTGQPVRGFPCLQQVSISHDYESQIAVNAYYPTQYIFDRAYGNYLGLCQLGAIVAHETGLRFSRLNCLVGRPELGDVNKSDVASLVAKVQQVIASSDSEENVDE